MRVIINGEARETAARTVRELLVELGLNPAGMVVEHNYEIVPASAYSQTSLVEGDVLELVRLVGGG